MTIHLKNAFIVDIDSPFHHCTIDLILRDGWIESISQTEFDLEADLALDLEGRIVTPGWLDLNAYFADPGFEHKEDIKSGSNAALNGGFTDVLLMPDSRPIVQSKSQIDYIKHQATSLVDLHISVALSKDFSEDKLNDLIDLISSGAKAFSNGDFPISNELLLINALKYTSDKPVPIFQNAYNKHIADGTQMHEGVRSTELGLKGNPNISEEIMVSRDLNLLKYAGGHLHFTKVSSKGSIDLIRKAKAEGMDVTCDVGIGNLLFTDISIEAFNSNFKNLPPYRSEEDRLALIEGVKDGTIDAICTNHRPHDQESKQLEYDLSEPGSINLQTFYPALLQLSEEIDFQVLVNRITHGPRGVLNLEKVTIEEGNKAKLTVLDSSTSWKLDDQTNLSKSRNSVFWDMNLTGKVVGLFNGNHHSYPL